MVAKSAVVNDMIELDHRIVRRTQLSLLFNGTTVGSKRRHEITMRLPPAERRRTAVGKIVETSRCFVIRCRDGNVVDGEIGPSHEISIDSRSSRGVPDAWERGVVLPW